MKVLHVTESFASGVLSFIDDLTRQQAKSGIEAHVLYAVRPDSPTRTQIENRFEPRVVLHAPIQGRARPVMMLQLAGTLRTLVRQHRFDAVHLHSSRAGVIGRVVLWKDRDRTFYSPHGFAFLRLSSSRPARAAAKWIERRLSRLGSLVLTSASEIDIAHEQLRATSVHFLRSGVARSSISPRPRVRRNRPRVITMARMVHQKAPWRFAHVARELSDIADFIWIGGDQAGRDRWFGDAPIEMIEWVTPDDLEKLIDAADIMLFPTLWEGFSLALVQAQAAGLPAVTSNVVGNRDAVLDGVTGYVCETDAELVEATRRLILDAELRDSMSRAAQERVRREFINDEMGADSEKIYLTGRAIVPRASALGGGLE